MANPRFAKPVWHLVDAKNMGVGRLATQVAHILRGKHKPTFTPNYNCGDYVVVINARQIKFTGNKEKDKLYRWHTGYPGGLKEISPMRLREQHPEDIFRKAVMGMLPKNRLRRELKVKLKIFPGSDHLHNDQIPADATTIITEKVNSK